MKRTVVIAIAAAGLVAGSAGGFALGVSRSASTTAEPGIGTFEGMAAMHDSPAMREFHAQMPAGLRAQCEGMHEQMDAMMAGAMGSGIMPGQGGVTVGPTPGGAMSDSLHESHHPDDEGA